MQKQETRRLHKFLYFLQIFFIRKEKYPTLFKRHNKRYYQITRHSWMLNMINPEKWLASNRFRFYRESNLQSSKKIESFLTRFFTRYAKNQGSTRRHLSHILPFSSALFCLYPSPLRWYSAARTRVARRVFFHFSTLQSKRTLKKMGEGWKRENACPSTQSPACYRLPINVIMHSENSARGVTDGEKENRSTLKESMVTICERHVKHEIGLLFSSLDHQI